MAFAPALGVYSCSFCARLSLQTRPSDGAMFKINPSSSIGGSDGCCYAMRCDELPRVEFASVVRHAEVTETIYCCFFVFGRGCNFLRLFFLFGLSGCCVLCHIQCRSSRLGIAFQIRPITLSSTFTAVRSDLHSLHRSTTPRFHRNALESSISRQRALARDGCHELV